MRRTLALLLPLIALAAASCDRQAEPTEAANLDPPAIPAATAEPIFREILAEMEDPPGAPGRRLSLVRYTIAPEARLAPHVHPGVQMASIVSGELTYRVVSGTATVRRAPAGDGATEVVDTLTGPTETTLGPGDAVIETSDMLHFGSNETAEPIVILAALITEAGKELAVPVVPAEGP